MARRRRGWKPGGADRDRHRLGRQAADTGRGDGQSRERHVMEGLPAAPARSEEHTSELQSLMRISYAVFCLKKKTTDMKNLYDNAMQLYHLNPYTTLNNIHS